MNREIIGFTVINDTRRRWRAIAIWIIVFTLLVFFGQWRLRTVTSDNKQAISEVSATKVGLSSIRSIVDDVKDEQDASCKNYEMLRDAVNLFHATLDGFLGTAEKARKVAYQRTHQQIDKEAADIYAALRKGITQVTADCAQHEGTKP